MSVPAIAACGLAAAIMYRWLWTVCLLTVPVWISGSLWAMAGAATPGDAAMARAARKSLNLRKAGRSFLLSVVTPSTSRVGAFAPYVGHDL
jgi:hypothetical protein